MPQGEHDVRLQEMNQSVEVGWAVRQALHKRACDRLDMISACEGGSGAPHVGGWQRQGQGRWEESASGWSAQCGRLDMMPACDK